MSIRLSDAEAALATFDEAVDKNIRSLLERDGAILRLIYTFEAFWKASQQLLSEHEGIAVASPNAAIRAVRGLGWLSDEDAETALDIGTRRNLAVYMYRGEIGQEIAEHLTEYAALLHRWLAALQERASQS